MSVEQVRTFGGWREARPFGVLGMDGRQTMIALVLMMAALLAGSINFVWLLVGAVITVGFVALSAIRWHGEPVGDVVRRRVWWRVADRRGWTTYQSDLADSTQRWQLPGPLATTVLVPSVDSQGRPWAVVWDRRSGRVTATLRVAPASTWLVPAAEADQWVSQWHLWLAGLGHQPTLVRAAVTVETAPSPASALAAAVLPRIDPAAPPSARDLMHTLVVGAPAASARVETRLSVTIDPARTPGGPPGSLDEAIAAFDTLLEGLATRLGMCGVGVLGRADADATAAWVRSAFDPAARDEVARGTQHLTWSQARPVRAKEGWDRYRADSGLSVSWVWDEAPRQQVPHDVLTNLLGPGAYAKRVTVIYEPMRAAHAAKLVDDQVQAAHFKSILRHKTGKADSARDEADRVDAQRAAQEEARGAGVCSVGLYATVTVTDPQRLPAAAADLEHRAEESKLRLRRAYGSQAVAFMAGLNAGVDPGLLRSH